MQSDKISHSAALPTKPVADKGSSPAGWFHCGGRAEGAVDGVLSRSQEEEEGKHRVVER
jgi:hypothetical protein